MKDKKGFTLVELLAVIAILAIIVLLSLPNVLKIFNYIKKNIFLTEVKTIYSESINKYLMESLDGNYIEIISSSGENKLSLDGKSIDYCVILDYQGEVSSIKVSDGNYNVDYSGNNINDIVLESINEGNLDLSECTISAPRSCTYDGELVPGATYVDGQYTYRYKKEKIHDDDDSGDEFYWRDINADGWGVILTDSESTDPVTTKLCSSINDKPIVSMALMFYESKASSVNLSTFDTSNVINMWGNICFNERR